MFARLFLAFLILAATPALAWRNGGTRVTVNDNTNYTLGTFPNTGQFLGFLGAFEGACAGLSGVNYADTLSVLPTTFPNNTVISWRWPPNSPVGPCGVGVWAFLQVMFGNYAGGTFVQVGAKQVKNITTLTQSAAIRVGGANTDNFDIVDDFFLTSASGSGTNQFEIEIFLHPNSAAVAFFNTGASKGSVVLGGITWDVAVVSGTAPDILLIKSDHTDALTTTIDMKAMFNYLIAQSVITGNEWYNGHGLGAEPGQSGGTLTIDQFSVNYN